MKRLFDRLKEKDKNNNELRISDERLGYQLPDQNIDPRIPPSLDAQSNVELAQERLEESEEIVRLDPKKEWFIPLNALDGGKYDHLIQRSRTDEQQLSPTEIDPPQEKKNEFLSKSPSHEELLKRIDNYANRSPWDDNTPRIDQLKIKQAYLDRIKKDGVNRNAQDIYYGQGLRYGLPHEPITKMQEDRQVEDQKEREDVLKKAKDYYKDNLGLNRDFNKDDQGMGMD